MRTDPCDEMRLLLQAELDGELDAARAAALAAHITDCAGCAETREELLRLSADLKRDVPYHPAPPELRARIIRQANVALAPAPAQHGWLMRWREALAAGGGLALAASIALFTIVPRAPDLALTVVSEHVRALQPGHLMDVVSSDQHTVKPWFDGRLSFSPPVKDLAARGFPLAGGRAEYLQGHEAAALIYYRAKHPIDLFIWPSRHGPSGESEGVQNGFNYVRWTEGGMTFWAVSDLNAAELREFVRLWREWPG